MKNHLKNLPINRSKSPKSTLKKQLKNTMISPLTKKVEDKLSKWKNHHPSLTQKEKNNRKLLFRRRKSKRRQNKIQSHQKLRQLNKMSMLKKLNRYQSNQLNLEKSIRWSNKKNKRFKKTIKRFKTVLLSRRNRFRNSLRNKYIQRKISMFNQSHKISYHKKMERIKRINNNDIFINAYIKN